MRNAVGYLMEPLLTQFFLIDAICKGYADEDQKKEIFKELARVFCVPMSEETERYYDVANSGLYKSITDYAAYERLCRTVEFAEKSGQDVEMNEVDRVVLARKREAMLIKAEIFKQSKNLTPDMITDTLSTTALNGNVDAMAILSYLEYHGLCICKDTKNAVKRLSLCAKWNHLFGNLMGIAYDAKRRDDYYNTLYTVLRSGNQKEVFRYVCEFTSYGKDCTKSPVARIIEKAFGLGVIKRDHYDEMFAKVAFSGLISAEDKEKLLLSKKKEAIASLSDFPFDAKRENQFSFDCAKAKKTPVCRDGELEKILCSLSPVTAGRGHLYQTLLVAGDDEYVADMYVSALKAGFEKKNKVIEVDAGMLSERDFMGTKEHFILRGLSETKETHSVFLIKHCEEIGETELEELKKLIDYGYRSKFKLLDPTVSIDLSDVLIVLFASESCESVRRLAEECDTVWTARINGEEKKTVIESTFKIRSKSFGIGHARLEEAGKSFLAPFETSRIIRIIDSALKKAAYDKQSLVTAESLRKLTAQQNVSAGRREFGYLGGVWNEEH